MKSTHFQTRASLGVLSPCDMTNHGGERGGGVHTRKKTEIKPMHWAGDNAYIKLILLLVCKVI